jgi:transcriptional regulator with XRE-family HTH domain
MSQSALAKESGTDRNQIIDYEAGRVWPQAEPLSRLLAALDATALDWLRALDAEARGPARSLEPAAWIAEPAQPQPDAGGRTEPGGGHVDMVRIRIKDLDILVPADRISIGPAEPPPRARGRRTP